jgi:hypothetical protein
MLNIYQNLLMEKGGCFPGEKGAFLERVFGKGGQGGEEGVFGLDFGCLRDLGRWSWRLGRWTMEKPVGSFYAVSGAWYVYGM